VRYWWVNQNQTFRQEIEGGYLWSPKRNKNSRRNPFYEFMREVAPGDIVFSFFDTRIGALGIVSGYCRESPKPEEFGTAGANWSQIGWRVGVRWQRLSNSVRPKDHIGRLRSFLANKYAPLTPDGNGLQGVYLTEINAGLAAQLFSLRRFRPPNYDLRCAPVRPPPRRTPRGWTAVESGSRPDACPRGGARWLRESKPRPPR
jgi:hypothetical protein